LAEPQSELSPPAFAEVEALAREIAHSPGAIEVTRLGEGWNFWAYRAGDLVLRFPKGGDYTMGLAVEAKLLHELAPTLSLPISVIELHEDGPHGLPFTSHQLVPGVPLRELRRAAAPGFGAKLGRFLREMHSFSIDRASALGFEVVDGARARAKRYEWYETLVRKVFPLLSCETRSYAESRLNAYLNDPANFQFEPHVTHGDIDQRNVLADPATGELTGVIDFGDVRVDDDAGDYTWALLGGFAELGIEDQIPDLLREAGITESEIRQRCEFFHFCWPLHEILHGLSVGDQDFTQEGIRSLNAAVPHGIRCS
jgi:aminoglycoside 2''-phosphotransferase